MYMKVNSDRKDTLKIGKQNKFTSHRMLVTRLDQCLKLFLFTWYITFS